MLSVTSGCSIYVYKFSTAFLPYFTESSETLLLYLPFAPSIFATPFLTSNIKRLHTDYIYIKTRTGRKLLFKRFCSLQNLTNLIAGGFL